MANDPSRGSVSLALRQIKDHSRTAVKGLWIRYFPGLVRVAQGTLKHLPHRLHDADDAAQSAFISFWKQISRDGISETLDRNSLWKLLATMAARKAKQIVRRDCAAKRGGGAVVNFSSLDKTTDNINPSQLIEQLSSEDFDLACEERLAQLPEDLRQFAVLRLFGHTNVEIAELLKCSQRKVERKLNLIRSYWTNDQV